jgi:hypothetical protein
VVSRNFILFSNKKEWKLTERHCRMVNIRAPRSRCQGLKNLLEDRIFWLSCCVPCVDWDSILRYVMIGLLSNFFSSSFRDQPTIWLCITNAVEKVSLKRRRSISPQFSVMACELMKSWDNDVRCNNVYRFKNKMFWLKTDWVTNVTVKISPEALSWSCRICF